MAAKNLSCEQVIDKGEKAVRNATNWCDRLSGDTEHCILNLKKLALIGALTGDVIDYVSFTNSNFCYILIMKIF